MKRSGRGGTRTLDLTDVNRDPLFPNRHPHGYPENSYRADAGKTIRAECGWLNRADAGIQLLMSS